MKLLSLKTLILAPVLVFVLFYAIGAILLLSRDQPVLEPSGSPSAPLEVAILGASGTAGDGILEAALASPDVGNIRVFTRRVTQRIQAGVDSGKVIMTLHQDYLDYSSLLDQLAGLDAVFWAIGINSLGVDEKTYGMIHVDFPMRFVDAWMRVSSKPSPSFHYISSSDISEDSSAMWAREKIRAEKSLFEFAEGNALRVIAYRPDYIGPTDQEVHMGQSLLYWFFKPVGAAVKATQIGEAMIDVSLRGPTFESGTKLSTLKIVRHAEGYSSSQPTGTD